MMPLSQKIAYWLFIVLLMFSGGAGYAWVCFQISVACGLH